MYENALAEISKKRPNVEKVLSLLKRSIDEGDGRACYALGSWYLHGQYVKKNLKKATALLRKAAKENVPDALYDLAVSYETGIGLKKSEKLAFDYYLRAALNGDKQSVYEVGRCYYYGIGVDRNKHIASIWLDHAKNLGLKGDEVGGKRDKQVNKPVQSLNDLNKR
ncbi:MAG: tetratricopeptide repeat protein [Candidatus Thiodiazotropha endolucinida]